VLAVSTGPAVRCSLSIWRQFLDVFVEVGTFLPSATVRTMTPKFFRLDALRQRFQALSFFGTLDFLGDGDVS
jgi:hypothetical protein